MKCGHYVYKYVYKGEIVYIGKNDTDLVTRIKQHAREEKFKPYEEADVYYFELPTRTLSDAWESILIAKYKPRLNIQKVVKHPEQAPDAKDPEWTLFDEAEMAKYRTSKRGRKKRVYTIKTNFYHDAFEVPDQIPDENKELIYCADAINAAFFRSYNIKRYDFVYEMFYTVPQVLELSKAKEHDTLTFKLLAFGGSANDMFRFYSASTNCYNNGSGPNIRDSPGWSGFGVCHEIEYVGISELYIISAKTVCEVIMDRKKLVEWFASKGVDILNMLEQEKLWTHVERRVNVINTRAR